ncbi:hypothetical protein GCM10010497_59740 [Streptomyces cinereoruber]|uniref:DUF1622 domain-containing protein n=1 Tax=Streptomyces cinereoruber TaxID=67260 RepID=A0AAV4KSC4_9ACTN|nr:DUF1622 domain-containing protein [Streptomyces cinereoruber]MBB4161678.1 putative membrane protein [Streptomyces cinereoruber]MBY8820006.1 DUF1622 domain-containing protein [Streptomyces cinereoruber]NIH65363.1 putative membrane protein [Streptomyces cinereoruber]QEV30892.1 DUF1622 domain-containing protein [Streptomyces cinereoruber]GGR48328.1 hypothetical protein GCM10010497_59740 [Streptomyces cinereoruber]
MNTLLHTASLLLTVCGLLGAAAAYRLSHTFRSALAVLLDFLTAAGLIQLAGDPSWNSILQAAAVIALRKLLSTGLTLPLKSSGRA